MESRIVGVRRAGFNSRGALPARRIATLIAVCLSAGDTRAANKIDSATTADRLVAEATQAALEGHSSQSFALLREAVRVAPDHKLARWQLGQVQVDGEWLAVEEAQRRTEADPRQAEYRKLRQAHGESPQGQLSLARWCRKNDLDEEARFHWASVLTIDPANEEALQALGMRWQNGQLLTPQQIAAQKERLRELKQAEKRWAPKIARWRRAVAGSDAATRGDALDEIRALTATHVILPLEKLTLGREVNQKKPPSEFRQISLAFLEALEKMPEPAAAESLVRHALFSPLEDARISAVEKLKARPMHEYVPILLSGLAMPVESSFQVRTDTDGSVHYWHSLYREGPDGDWSLDRRRSAVQHNLGSRRYIWDVYTNKVQVTDSPQAAAAIAVRTANIANAYGRRFGKTAAATESQVGELNRAVEASNSMVAAILTATTGQKLSDNPNAWWEWWQAQNDYYASDDRPVEQYYDTDTDRFYHGGPQLQITDSRPPPPPPPPPPGGYRRSCFAKGTLVWTKTGQRPIETLELGDLVLAQNVESGELTYKPVIARTVRPPSEILKLSVGGESLRTTRGHPLWVAGLGWRMAKELGDGAILHGVTGSQRVRAIESDGEEEAFNLVVADFNTYFVGESGILVHDNTHRRPTRAAMPGLAAK